MTKVHPAPIITKAHGRVCLFGDHQDYLGFPVIATTISPSIQISGIRNGTTSLRISMPDIGKSKCIDLSQEYPALQSRDYLTSGLKVMQEQAIQIKEGYDIEISGDIPINSGLSSSSALTVAWIRFLDKAFSTGEMTALEVGHCAYQAEVLEHGESGGIMDQYTIAHEGLVHIKTSETVLVSEIKKSIPGLVIADSGVSKRTVEILRLARRMGTEALNFLSDKTGRKPVHDWTLSQLEGLDIEIPEAHRAYLHAAISNHDITRAALHELGKAELDLDEIANLMNAHQRILRDLLGVSTPELDRLCTAALDAGALSAKLVGSGGGGCIVALAPGHEEAVIHALKSERMGCVFLA